MQIYITVRILGVGCVCWWVGGCVCLRLKATNGPHLAPSSSLFWVLVQYNHVCTISKATSSSPSSSRLSMIGGCCGWGSSPRPALDKTSIQRCCTSSPSALKYRVKWLWDILKAWRRSRRSHDSGKETSKPIRGMLRCAFTSWKNPQESKSLAVHHG